ncbi:MAG: hypothetical protein H7X80_04355 [bacterium]|nr:hypothetical protein [Candidatus Kapabacteria bacterium]
MITFRASTVLTCLFAITSATAGITTICRAQDNRSKWLREPTEIRHTLDSLVSVSEGPYVHFVIGTCLGGRCEERVSIFRSSAEEPFIYRAGAWVGIPHKPQFYTVNQNISDEDAGAILADARLAGIMSLLADTIAPNNRSSRFWLRARFGNRAVHIDDASLASPSYADTTASGMRALYKRVEDALSGRLRDQHRLRD